MKRLPFTFVGILLALFTVLVFTYSLVSGPVSLPAYGSLLAAADALLGTELSPFNQVERVIVAELRLPRSLLAFLVGALLAQCGAVMQGLFRNPLADPGIIGVSAGAALGAVVAIALLPASWMDWSLSVGAFLGGLAATSFVYGLSRSPSGTSIIVLLLAGVAIAALAGAVIGVMSYFVDDQQLRDISVWQMGSLSGASLASVGLCLLTLALTTLFFQRYAFALNALLLGEPEARHLGIDVEKLKLRFFVVTALAVGVAVATSGLIGFIGLVVPHLIRLICGPDHRILLPLSALLGGLLLMASDIISRLVLAPAELPVGLITALLGSPFFIILLLQQRSRWTS